MKIIINQKQLLPALLACNSVVERKQTIPILSNLLFKLKEKVLYITGSNLEVEITRTIPFDSDEEFFISLSSNKLVDICRALPSGCNITIRVEDGKAIITAAKSRFTLKTLPPEDFPKLKLDDFEERFSVPAAAFKNMLELTAFSMAAQDVRFYLNGLLLEVNKDRLIVVATDGHRLSKSEVILSEDQSPDKHQIIIPLKATQEIIRLLSNLTDEKQENKTSDIKVEFNKKHLYINTPNTTISSTLINGQYPDYAGILATNLDKTIQINRQHFLDTLVRTAILTNDIRHGVRLHFTEDNILNVSTNNPEQEAAEDELPCVYDGKEITTSFNVNYMIEALKVIDSEEVLLHIKDKDSVCLLEKPGDSLSSWMVMPMRL